MSTEDQGLNKKRKKKWLVGLLIGAGLILAWALVIDQYVELEGKKFMVKAEEAPPADAILILGAYVSPTGEVSEMLKERLLTGLDLYKRGKAPKIIVSGDHGRKEYDEVNGMKHFLEERQVKSEDIFMDHAGFSTYESIYRARDIFQVRKVIIVSQEYHLVRALFSARQMGLDAYGVGAFQDYLVVNGRGYRIREVAARNKDFLWSAVFHPEPTFLGEVIPVSGGDGRVTDDKN